jgi:uncharacterized membrane protein YqhA
LKVGTNDLPSVLKKKVVAVVVSVSSTEAFPMVRLALQLEVPTAVAASIHLKVVAIGIHLEAATTATSEAAQLWDTLPTASRVVCLYENPIT